MLTVDLLVLLDKGFNRGVAIGNHAVPPVLQFMVGLRLLTRLELPVPEVFLHRSGVDFAHQFADILQLTFARTVARRDAPGLVQRLEQPVREAERFPVRLGNLEQLLAQFLQGVRVALELRLAGRRS